ncbi:hypothetical protein E2C01_069666 [Portunus trituberculatus]|uniref:Uncharacterized protein n=1 Tax=Portunus trituberculatus TaxID=210409 RepID=A0A5B7HS53_PORTR|nr:hypothetical protein [Portunus trituberculatus]
MTLYGDSPAGPCRHVTGCLDGSLEDRMTPVGRSGEMNGMRLLREGKEAGIEELVEERIEGLMI